MKKEKQLGAPRVVITDCETRQEHERRLEAIRTKAAKEREETKQAIERINNGTATLEDKDKAQKNISRKAQIAHRKEQQKQADEEMYKEWRAKTFLLARQTSLAPVQVNLANNQYNYLFSPYFPIGVGYLNGLNNFGAVDASPFKKRKTQGEASAFLPHISELPAQHFSIGRHVRCLGVEPALIIRGVGWVFKSDIII
jgi:hypothetical protein